MSLAALATKRIRREWEPEEKSWHDSALQLPWEEVQPPLHKTTIFSLKNVFFFSHATAVQAMTLQSFTCCEHSAVVEAPTGSGKTLSFLIPIMERTLRACEAFVETHQRPPLSRQVLGVIFSPSRTLAEQTFVIGRNFAARYPFNIQFALCDGIVERPADVMRRLTSGTRGAGTFLVTTPKDFAELLPLIEAEEAKRFHTQDEKKELLAEQDTATRKKYLAKQKQRHQPNSVDDQQVLFASSATSRFLLIIDEADLTFNSPEMRRIVTSFIEVYCTPANETPQKKRKKAKKQVASSSGALRRRLMVDFAFVGATVATSDPLIEYAKDICKRCCTSLHMLTSQSNHDFVSQLSNRFLVCDTYSFLPYFVQLMNLHASKKHFVFFNNYRVLQFVQRLFSLLCHGTRPILFISKVFVMYEGMTETARIEQYNQFLTHSTCDAAASRRPKKALSEAEKTNQFFTSGWKRDGKVEMGTGAILLCTDIAAFGLDVRDVDYVYHFEPPATVQSYIHRVGRVGRMGMRGSSILLLPCNASSDAAVQSTRERKTTSTRFNTLTNTKYSTGDIQSVRVTADSLPQEKQDYVKELSKHHSLEEYNLPPFAPITSTLRNIIAQDEKLVKLAKRAAIAMCDIASEEKSTWFNPKLALRSLLLD